MTDKHAGPSAHGYPQSGPQAFCAVTIWMSLPSWKHDPQGLVPASAPSRIPFH